MPVVAVAAVVGAAAVVGGTIYSASQTAKQGKAQRRQYKFERQLAQNQAAKQRRDAIRAARIAGADLAQFAETTGGSTSSSFLGAMGSIQSQLTANLSFLDTNQKLADQASIQAGKAAQAATNASIGSAVAGLGASVFNAAGGFGAFK